MIFICLEIINANKNKKMDAHHKMFHAIEKENIEEIKLLLPEITNKYAFSPKSSTTYMNVASWVGNTEIIELLYLHNFDINFASYDAETPLMTAISCNKIECVKFLLKLGANPRFMSKKGISAYFIAMICKNEKIKKYYRMEKIMISN